MTPPSNAGGEGREVLAREVLASLGDEHFAAAVLHGDSLDNRMSFNATTVIRAMLAFSDRENATPRSMPEEVVEAYERAAKVAEDHVAELEKRAQVLLGWTVTQGRLDSARRIAAAIRALVPSTDEGGVDADPA